MMVAFEYFGATDPVLTPHHTPGEIVVHERLEAVKRRRKPGFRSPTRLKLLPQ
jgi:hypothetical protein